MDNDAILDRAYTRVLDVGDMPDLTEALGALENANSAWRIQVLIQQVSAVLGNRSHSLEPELDAYVCLRFAEL